jgi:hypothetical protein
MYAVIRELRHDYSYVYSSAQIGRWSSLALFLLSCFAEAKCRGHLLICAAGLCFFTALASESCLEAQLQNKPPAGTMQIS